MPNGIFEGTYGTMYYVSSMEKAVKYYREVFGATPTFESAEWTEFNLDGHRLCLHISDPDRDLTESGGGILITSVENIKDLVPRLKDKGVEFIRDVLEVHPGAYAADFKDPAGNVVSLYEDTGQR